MKRFGVVGLIAVASMGRLEAASQIYVNFGSVTNVPQIDAISFANHGLFTVSAPLPYETQNTLNFTNTAVMQGSPGFVFENISSTGVRRPAANFFNAFDARVSGGAGGLVLPGAVSGGLFSFGNGQVRVSATNIVNKGSINADGAGLIRLNGQTVDLSRSAVGVLPFLGASGIVTPTNFTPSIGVLDLYWGMNDSGNQSFDTSTLVAPVAGATNFMVTTPPHVVTNASGFGFQTSLQLDNGSGFVITNAVTPTNWIIQAVFVQVADPALLVDVRFSPSTIQTNPYQTAIVEFKHPETNVLQGGQFETTFYVLDRMASETNFVLLTNLLTLNTFRPSTYEVTRATPFEFLSGLAADPGASTNAAAIVYNPVYTNTVGTNIYAAYGFNITNIASVPPAIPGISLMDLPGRVEIEASDLNLNRTRLRGEGIISIKTKNLRGTNTVMDVQNVVLDVGSTSGNLRIENLVKEFVERTAGDVFCWSAMWTNQTSFEAPTGNQIPDPADPTMMIDEVATNLVDIGVHVLVVDSRAVLTQLPVIMAQFSATTVAEGQTDSTLVLGDTLRIGESFFIDTTNLVVTSTGKIILPQGVPDWNAENVPRLLNLENNGLISIANRAFFGTNRVQQYASIINNGSIEALALAFRADLFENTGALLADAGIFSQMTETISVEAKTAIFLGGSVLAGGEVRIGATDLIMDAVAIETEQPLVLMVTNSVADGGLPDGNLIRSEGFALLTKPRVGDFLGTVFESDGPPFFEVVHVWAGQDRGAEPEGFVNNAAIGHLILDGKDETQFRFRGADSVGNALYVEFLELKGTVPDDVLSTLYVDPNMVVYFADSNVPADQLNGLFADSRAPQGRLRWVPTFVGANSSVRVMSRTQNQLVSMNRALRTSATIDSDGDGIVNRDDAYPLDADSSTNLSVNNLAFDKQTSTLTFSWDAQPGKTYVVEYAASLTASKWQVLLHHTNRGTSVASARAQDQVPADATQRYYRIRPVSSVTQ